MCITTTPKRANCCHNYGLVTPSSQVKGGYTCVPSASGRDNSQYEGVRRIFVAWWEPHFELYVILSIALLKGEKISIQLMTTWAAVVKVLRDELRMRLSMMDFYESPPHNVIL